MSLSTARCIPCEGGEPLGADTIAELQKSISPEWHLCENDKAICRGYTFKNFVQALRFVNSVGELAESEGHHPDIDFGWGRVDITLTTHAVSGLSENDFIVAAKIDALHT
jgi:4a-hydroxytetrahydrobiopterin dehydratase